MYGKFYSDALKIEAVRKAIENGSSDFTFDKNKSAKRQLERLLNGLSSQVNALITSGNNNSFKLGEKSVDSTVLDTFGGNKKADDFIKQALRDHKTSAITASKLSNQKRGGLTLSDRVWNLKENSTKEIEIAIQNGILEGKGAAEISRDITKFLNNPDALFRRVKNKETGELEWSKAAKNFKPGQGSPGIYRSAHRNAMRLLRTEMARAYRRAEWERFQTSPFIVGYKISLSNNHTVLINGKPVPFHDICDELAGEYPKEFLWEGWHPQCRCIMLPILISDKEFERLRRLKIEGRENEFKPKNVIKNPPKKFYDWIRNSKERLANAKSLPFWMQDNIDLAEIRDVAESNIRVKSLRNWAKENIQQTTIHHNQLNRNIEFTGKGLKEYLNQPHKHYYEKNELIKDISNILKNSKYLGSNKYVKRNPMILNSHVFEIEIKGEKSWLIVREDKANNLSFYSISDNEKVLKGLKRK